MVKTSCYVQSEPSTCVLPVSLVCFSPQRAVLQNHGARVFLCITSPPAEYQNKCQSAYSTDPYEYSVQVRIQGGAPGARAPPLTLGFEAPKLSIFGPYLIFP